MLSAAAATIPAVVVVLAITTYAVKHVVPYTVKPLHGEPPSLKIYLHFIPVQIVIQVRNVYSVLLLRWILSKNTLFLLCFFLSINSIILYNISMKILLMGPQGCGKGTIGSMLADRIGVPLLSVGELLRSLDESSVYYQKVQQELKEGALVSEEIVVGLLKDELTKEKYKKGYIFDGWARSIENIEAFNPGFDYVVVFEMSRETSIKRISGRRTCTADGKTYNIYTLPKEELAKCSGPLVQREDDTEEAVKKRLEIYYTETVRVIKLFDKQGKTIHINSEPLPQVIFADLMSKLGLAP
jgi:adenylate kinase